MDLDRIAPVVMSRLRCAQVWMCEIVCIHHMTPHILLGSTKHYMTRITDLPVDALRLIWRALQNERWGVVQIHQHALRCTCKAMRNASNAWITKLLVVPPYKEDETTEETQQEAMRQMLSFPAPAQHLRHLVWSVDGPCLMPTFMAAASRLQRLQLLDVYVEVCT